MPSQNVKARNLTALLILRACQSKATQYFYHMSLQELKAEAEALTGEERFELEAYLRQLRLQENPEEQRELAEINERMDAGEKIRWPELRRRHEELKTKGL